MKKKKKIPTPSEQKIEEVMHEFKEGELHSGKGGKIVTNRKQAISIALSEADKVEDESTEKEK